MEHKAILCYCKWDQTQTTEQTKKYTNNLNKTNLPKVEHTPEERKVSV